MYVKCLSPDRFRLRTLFRFSGDFIYKDIKDSTPFTQLCEDSIKQMRRSYIILAIVIFITVQAVSAGPILAYLRDGVKVTPFGTKTPFFEEDSDVGFTVDMVYQSCLMPFGIVSTICIELCQCMTYNTIELCSGIIALNTQLLTESLEKQKKLTVQTYAHFRNMLMQIQDYDQ